MGGDTRFELKPVLGELARLADAVEAFSGRNGLDSATAGQLTLALDEIFTNAVTYGGLPADAAVEIRLGLDGADLVATVSDPGPAFDPLDEAVVAAEAAVDTGAPIDERPVGGLGLFIVRSLARELAYAREGSRNRLTMRFALPPPPPPPPPRGPAHPAGEDRR